MKISITREAGLQVGSFSLSFQTLDTMAHSRATDCEAELQETLAIAVGQIVRELTRVAQEKRK